MFTRALVPVGLNLRQISWVTWSLSLLFTLAAFGCEEEPLTAPDAFATPQPESDTQGGSETPQPDPVPCDALQGTWQLALCNEPAGTAQLVPAGCEFTLISKSPSIASGGGELVNGRELQMHLQTPNYGVVQCVAEMRPASFSGLCDLEIGTCSLEGVRAH